MIQLASLLNVAPKGAARPQLLASTAGDSFALTLNGLTGAAGSVTLPGAAPLAASTLTRAAPVNGAIEEAAVPAFELAAAQPSSPGLTPAALVSLDVAPASIIANAPLAAPLSAGSQPALIGEVLPEAIDAQPATPQPIAATIPAPSREAAPAPSPATPAQPEDTETPIMLPHNPHAPLTPPDRQPLAAGGKPLPDGDAGLFAHEPAPSEPSDDEPAPEALLAPAPPVPINVPQAAPIAPALPTAEAPAAEATSLGGPEAPRVQPGMSVEQPDTGLPHASYVTAAAPDATAQPAAPAATGPARGPVPTTAAPAPAPSVTDTTAPAPATRARTIAPATQAPDATAAALPTTAPPAPALASAAPAAPASSAAPTAIAPAAPSRAVRPAPTGQPAMAPAAPLVQSAPAEAARIPGDASIDPAAAHAMIAALEETDVPQAVAVAVKPPLDSVARTPLPPRQPQLAPGVELLPPAVPAASALAAAGLSLDAAPQPFRFQRASNAVVTPLAPAPLDAAVTAQAVAPVAFDAREALLDMRRDQWAGEMVEMIDALRDASPTRETRIRLAPDMLGSVDIAVRQEGERVHVHFAAENQAARQMLTEAQPRLAEIAEQRGMKLGQTSVDSGAAGQNSQRGEAGQGQNQPSRPASARTAAKSTASSNTDERIA